MYNEMDVLKLNDKLEILRKNDEVLTQEEKNGRYKKAYNALIQEIKDIIFNCIHTISVMNWDYLPEDEKEKEETIKKAHQLIDERLFNNKDAADDFYYVVFNSYSEDLTYRKAELLIGNLEMELYYPYWQKMCKKIKSTDFVWMYPQNNYNVEYKFFNLLNSSFWHPEYHLWVGNQGDRGYFNGGGDSPIREEAQASHDMRFQIDKEKLDEFYESMNKIETIEDEGYIKKSSSEKNTII